MARRLAPKSEMSSLDVRAAVRELRQLQGSRIDKAYETTPGELLLRLRGGTPPKKVEISILVGKALHVTALPRENPEKPTSFVMQLRKHLANGFVDEVRQHHFDRIVEFVSKRREGTYLLVVELFADGNVVLVKDDSDGSADPSTPRPRGRIVTPLVAQSWASREVRPGAEWVPPPARLDPTTLARDEFHQKVRASNADAVRTLATEVNLGGPLAEEVCAQAGVPKATPVAELSEEQVDALADALRRILTRVETGALDPVVASEGETKVDVAPFPMALHAGLTLTRYPTFHQALDAYFGKAVTVERVDPRLAKVDAERAKAQRMADAQTAAIARFEREEEDARRKGDLLYAHFQDAGRVAAALWEASKGAGWKALQERIQEGKAAGKPEALMVDALLPHEGGAVLVLEAEHGEKAKVRVDLRKSVQENADALYGASKKFREKRKGALEALARTRARLAELEARGAQILDDVSTRKARRPTSKQFWFEQWRWFFTSDGHLVLAGRDVRSNEKLVAKQLEDNDRYLHADVSGAPSVVVKARGGQVSQTALQEAATFAACMSRVWNAGHASAEAYWVTPQQVSKTPNPGEYVAKGSFIIRGKRSFLRTQVRLAVGEVEVEGGPGEGPASFREREGPAGEGANERRERSDGRARIRKIMGGPVPALAARSARYVVLEPGDTPTNELANKLARVFDVNVEEVQAALPPAGVRVVEAKGIEL